MKKNIFEPLEQQGGSRCSNELSCENCEIFRNNCFEEQLVTTASVIHTLPKMTLFSWMQWNPSEISMIENMAVSIRKLHPCQNHVFC